MMKLKKPKVKRNSLFQQPSNSNKSINNQSQTREESRIINQPSNEESLIILLKEDKATAPSNADIINKAAVNLKDNTTIAKQRHQSMEKGNRNELLGFINTEKKVHSSEVRYNESKAQHSPSASIKEESRELKRLEKICDSSSEEESDLDKDDSTFTVIPYNNYHKQIWDHAFIVYVIALTIILPIIVSFSAHIAYIISFEIVNTAVMTAEILLRFKSAYINEDDNIVEKPKDIWRNYLKTWFIIDIITWFPYSLCAIEQSTYSSKDHYSRFSQDIPLLQKILLLINLMQMLKILMKGQFHSFLKLILDLFRINSMVERLIYFLISFVLMNHVVACLWFFTANLQYFSPNCWVVKLGYIDHSIGELYLACYSWSLATITTIGFGNISAGTSIERIYNLIVMSFGVVMFSFAIGSLSSIVNLSDRRTREMSQKLQMLSLIEKEYSIDKETCQRIRSSIKYNHSHNSLGDNTSFLKELPSRLSIELSQIMLDSKIKQMNFFTQYPNDGLFATIAPLLNPVQFIQRDILYKCNDKIEEMYFISVGTVSFCLGQEYNEKEIKMIKKHSNFGEIEMCIGEVIGYNIKVKSRACNLFLLKKGDFLKLSIRFQETIEEFMQRSLMIHIRFKDKMKAMMSKADERCIVDVCDDSFSLGDKTEDVRDAELECIDESNEEDMVDVESDYDSEKDQSSANEYSDNKCSNNTEQDKKENGRQTSNSLSDTSSCNENKEGMQDEVKKLKEKFERRLNSLIDFIDRNCITYGVNSNESPLDLLIRIRNNKESLKTKNMLLVKVEKLLSEAIPLL